jgi:hypothetical protein
MRKSHGRPRTGLQLLLYSALILPKNVAAPARVDFAGLQVQQQFNLPGSKRIPRRLAALQLSEKPAEAVQQQLPLFEFVIERGHEDESAGEGRYFS